MRILVHYSILHCYNEQYCVFIVSVKDLGG
jgi:hypothetical protein